MNGMTWNEIPGDIIVSTTDRTILPHKSRLNFMEASQQIKRYSKYNLPKSELKDKINEAITAAIRECKYDTYLTIHRQNSIYISELMEELDKLYNFQSRIEHNDTETIICINWIEDKFSDKRSKRNRR
jgi:hypothetical protein